METLCMQRRRVQRTSGSIGDGRIHSRSFWPAESELQHTCNEAEDSADHSTQKVRRAQGKHSKRSSRRRSCAGFHQNPTKRDVRQNGPGDERKQDAAKHGTKDGCELEGEPSVGKAARPVGDEAPYREHKDANASSNNGAGDQQTK